MLAHEISKGIEDIGLYDNLDIDLMMAFRNLVYFKIVWDTYFKDGPLKVCRYTSSIYFLSQFLSIYIMIVGLGRAEGNLLKPTMLVNNCIVHLFIPAFIFYEYRISFDGKMKRWISDVIFE